MHNVQPAEVPSKTRSNPQVVVQVDPQIDIQQNGHDKVDLSKVLKSLLPQLSMLDGGGSEGLSY